MGSIMSMQWPTARSRRTASRRPEAAFVIQGAWHELGGRLMVLRGTLARDDVIRAAGYRQQLIGLLQRVWGRDRSSVTTWVDAHIRNGSGRPGPSGRSPGEPRAASTQS
jgi:hypothetical protein